MTARRVAVFIDGENVPPWAADDIIKEAAKHGDLGIRRVYGNFADKKLAKWLNAAPLLALTPCQTVAGAAGKNGTDIALVIDAMDVLCSENVDMFCVATCDGDFTQLAMRIRQGGKTFVGIGMPNASARFRAACDIFRPIDLPKTEAKPTASASRMAETPVVRHAVETALLQRAFDVTPLLDGKWVWLPDLMKSLKSCESCFEVKAYGHSQLSKLLVFSGVELADNNRKARLKTPVLMKVVDNG